MTTVVIDHPNAEVIAAFYSGLRVRLIYFNHVGTWLSLADRDNPTFSHQPGFVWEIEPAE